MESNSNKGDTAHGDQADWGGKSRLHAGSERRRGTCAELFVPNPKLRLREQVREVMRYKHYSVRTEETYWQWTRQYILFHGKRHPREMGDREVEAFLTHLAANKNVAVSTQNQALNGR